MKTVHLLFLNFTFLPLTACYRLGILPTATPLPLPTELATTPLPQGSQPGGMEAVFRSLVSIDGEKDSRCYKMYRFYPDGLALYADLACFDRSPVAGNWSEIDRWFNRENREVARGDYFLLGQQIWVRIVTYNSIYETTNLRSFQGEVCQDEMVLQEPAQTYYAGIPSELSQPVLEYIRLDITGPHQATSALSVASPLPGDHSLESCHVARFQIVKRPSIVLSGNRAEYQIQTDPGEPCTLRYTAPDGAPSHAQGTGTITANSQGICQWNWEVGDLEGIATVMISIDEITQDFQIEVR